MHLSPVTPRTDSRHDPEIGALHEPASGSEQMHPTLTHFQPL